MDNQEKDIYKELFLKQALDSPSMSFENSLMHRVRLEHIKQERKRNRWSFVYMILGVLSLIVLPVIILTIMGWDWSPKDVLGDSVSIFEYIKEIELNPFVVLICVSLLFLLFLDSLIQKYLRKKENESHS